MGFFTYSPLRGDKRAYQLSISIHGLPAIKCGFKIALSASGEITPTKVKVSGSYIQIDTIWYNSKNKTKLSQQKGDKPSFSCKITKLETTNRETSFQKRQK